MRINLKSEHLLLEKHAFDRYQIEKRLAEGNFGSIARFEQFIWDLELFLQLQSRLGKKVILKGGAAVQFYIPITKQRTSVDIDIICLATREEVGNAITDIEEKLSDPEGNFRFKLHKPKKPRLSLDKLDTYYVKVPSVCNDNELKSLRGVQEIKCEFIFSSNKYPFSKIKKPKLFALETDNEFNVLDLEYLLADKLTTIGPTTIGISDDRIDEQFKQLYDVTALVISNFDILVTKKNCIKDYYKKAVIEECDIQGISYSPERLFADMKLLIDRIKNIENDAYLFKVANDFQSLYLRKEVNRDKAQWAILGYQLDMFIEHLFRNDDKFMNFKNLENLINRLSYNDIRGPERGGKIKNVRKALEQEHGNFEGLSSDIFNKRLNRVIWELASKIPYKTITDTIRSQEQ